MTRVIKFNWLDRLQLFHTLIFWSIVVVSMYKLMGYIDLEWGILLQLWILNLFTYVFLSVGNSMKLPIGFISIYLFYMSLYLVMVGYSLSRF